jgi:hypothetical protein
MNYMPNSKAAALVARIREAKENVAALRELWITYFGEPMPDDQQFLIWLTRYGFDIAVEAIEELASWLNRHEQELQKIAAEGRAATPEETIAHAKKLLDLIRYVSGIMKKKKAEQDGTAE